MAKITLSKESYLDKMHGCWLGKNIGNRFKFNVLVEAVEARNILGLSSVVGQMSEKLYFTILGPSAIRSIPASTHAPRD